MNNGINFIQLRNIYFLKIFIVIFICEVMCEGWHFTHIWKHLHDLLISLQTEICVHETSLAPPCYIEVRKVSGHVYMFMGIAFDSLNYFSIGIWCCSDVIVLNVVNFIINFHNFIFNT